MTSKVSNEYPNTDTLLDEFALPDDLRVKAGVGLGQMLAALADEPLHAMGREMALASIRDDLSRLQAIVDDRKRYPEITEVEIEQPLFILGLPRCGTSLLHALMGADSQIRTPMQWEVAFPSPPPGVNPEESGARYDDYLRAHFGSGLEGLKKAHPIGPDIPQECGAFMRTSFESSNPVMAYRIPAFYDWFLGIDAHFRYEVHKMWLQHLGWRTERKHWVLKIQEHMYKMPALRRAYPDAVFVQPHRDPATVVASISQLIYERRRPGYDHQDRKALGREMLRLWHDGIACLMKYRGEHQDTPIYDVCYRELVADSVATIRTIYERFGWDFTDESATAIRAWLGNNPPDKHGRHTYSLDDFGLSVTDVRAVYEDYEAAYRDYV